jgi:hypothetical protein
MTSHRLPNTATTLAIDAPTAAAVRIVACPECGLAAEIVDHAVLPSTAGPVDMVHVVCVQRHWFKLPIDRLATPPPP